MMIEKLKEETRDLHEEVEKDNLAGQIMDHSIDEETYSLLLLQNYFAYRSVESAIFEWLPKMKPVKYLQLEQDLRALKIPFFEIPFSAEFSCNNRAEAFGAAYVVEGSALGGMLIAKNLKRCQKLESIEEFYFFNGNKNNLDSWKGFKNAIFEEDFSEEESQMCIEKARDTFRFFKKVFSTDFSVTR